MIAWILTGVYIMAYFIVGVLIGAGVTIIMLGLLAEGTNDRIQDDLEQMEYLRHLKEEKEKQDD